MKNERCHECGGEWCDACCSRSQWAFNRHGNGGTCGHQRDGTYTSGTSRSEEALDDLAVFPSEMLKAVTGGG